MYFLVGRLGKAKATPASASSDASYRSIEQSARAEARQVRATDAEPDHCSESTHCAHVCAVLAGTEHCCLHPDGRSARNAGAGKLADFILLDGNPLEGYWHMLKTKVALKGGAIVVDKR